MVKALAESTLCDRTRVKDPFPLFSISELLLIDNVNPKIKTIRTCQGTRHPIPPEHTQNRHSESPLWGEESM